MTRPDGWPGISPREWRKMTLRELDWYLSEWAASEKARRR